MKSLAVKALALIAMIAMTSPAFSQQKPYIIGVGEMWRCHPEVPLVFLFWGRSRRKVCL
jgi:hypothetical protein